MTFLKMFAIQRSGQPHNIPQFTDALELIGSFQHIFFIRARCVSKHNTNSFSFSYRGITAGFVSFK